jgi:hypothetical protein
VNEELFRACPCRALDSARVFVLLVPLPLSHLFSKPIVPLMTTRRMWMVVQTRSVPLPLPHVGQVFAGATEAIWHSRPWASRFDWLRRPELQLLCVALSDCSAGLMYYAYRLYSCSSLLRLWSLNSPSKVATPIETPTTVASATGRMRPDIFSRRPSPWM